MRIVDRKTFLALPADTLFCKYKNGAFSALEIKGETLPYNDFYVQSIADSVESSGSDEYLELLDAAEDTGINLNLDLDVEGRDGLYESDEVKFVVYDHTDVSKLIKRLQACCDPIDATHSIVLFKQPTMFDGNEFRSMWLANFLKVAKFEMIGREIKMCFPRNMASQVYDFFYYWMTSMLASPLLIAHPPGSEFYTLTLKMAELGEPEKEPIKVNMFPISLDGVEVLSKNPVITFTAS